MHRNAKPEDGFYLPALNFRECLSFRLISKNEVNISERHTVNWSVWGCWMFRDVMQVRHNANKAWTWEEHSRKKLHKGSFEILADEWCAQVDHVSLPTWTSPKLWAAISRVSAIFQLFIFGKHQTAFKTIDKPTFPVSAACLATASIESGDTVTKNPEL